MVDHWDFGVFGIERWRLFFAVYYPRCNNRILDLSLGTALDFTCAFSGGTIALVGRCGAKNEGTALSVTHAVAANCRVCNIAASLSNRAMQ
ncbi:MAG: hypothetical protein LBS96_07760 [Oscillospiraceae bacterium]|nr:hypothetical protein [Oscillospiraceae bacterium]